MQEANLFAVGMVFFYSVSNARPRAGALGLFAYRKMKFIKRAKRDIGKKNRKMFPKIHAII